MTKKLSIVLIALLFGGENLMAGNNDTANNDTTINQQTMSNSEHIAALNDSIQLLKWFEIITTIISNIQ